MPTKLKWHGWIYIEKSTGFTDAFFVNYQDKDGEWKRKSMGHSNEGADASVRFFDEHVGQPVKLFALGMLGYRVYTEIEDDERR